MSSSRTESGIVEVSMPQMGISVAEGTILEWRKRPGDWVEADETICDVSTDKVDVEIPAPTSGRLERILIEPGETVSVGTVIAELDTVAAPGEAHPEESRPERPERSEESRPERSERPEESRPELSERSSEPSADPASAAGEAPEVDRSKFYSPVVRRIAEERGIDLEQVEGTGVGGRVRKADLSAFLKNGGAEEVRDERPLHIESPYEPGQAVSAEELIGPTRRERMSPMRAQIARHMLDSRLSSAHCTTIVEVDFSRIARRRRELREAMARRGVNLTYLAFVAREAVAALERHPILNASIDGDEIVYHDEVNLGIAVALEDGLIVPVIRRAQRISLEGLAAAIGDLATRAREKGLHPDEVQGGTFTITNPGQFGAVLATPIINQPQVAILDLEAIVKRPVVLERDGEETIAIRPMSYLCMSWDHRALDGAEAARSLAGMKEALEEGGSE
ncbi:MAG TPA: dihydrolipoamide acetyltransferase family protein [Solirubrobacterales bacterium]